MRIVRPDGPCHEVLLIEVSEEVENRFMYVALTRASDYLTVICSGESRFVDRMLHG